ncbi:PH domain-containing protein [Xenorhabdus entomophaga]|uniref:PH domain-containing protein n=1 Tax=Xenorhabdus entomophaga TaxID=3136257 RepID=UPI0030F3E17C
MINYKTASDSDLLAELNKLSGDSSVGLSRRKKEFLYVIRNLGMNEQPIAVLAGDLNGSKGTLILLTNKNLHFIRISLFKKVHHDKFPLESINGCEDKKGLLFSTLTLSVNYQGYVFNNIEKKVLASFLSHLNELLVAHETGSYSKPSSQDAEQQSEADIPKSNKFKSSVLDTSSLVEKLELIEELKDFSEAINNKEFNILKNYILESNLDKSLATVNIKTLCENLDRLNDFVNDGTITKKDFSTQKQALLAALPTNNQSQ